MDRSRNGNRRRLSALILCAALFCALSLPAFAAETAAEVVSVPAAEAESNSAPVPEADVGSAPAADSLLDPAALTAMVEGFLAEQNIPADRVGIGFCYTATGDEWFYNGDEWFYPGSIYKVPLMMILAERVSAGMVSPDETVAGLQLPKLFDYIITHSNNDYAHAVRTYFGGDEVWREEAKQYAALADDAYDPRYMDYCYFSPRYITQVLETLYREPERFPMVLDCMLAAEQAHYFRLPDEMHDIPVAQKYGSYYDMEGTNWNHTAGIICTPNPFVLTVMTKNVGNYEWIIGRFALLFKDYALGLDEQFAAFKAAQETREAEQQAAEQAEAAAREAAAQTPAAQETPAGQTPPPVRVESLPGAGDREKQEQASRHLMYSLAATAAALLVLGVAGAVLVARYKRKKRFEGYRRRFEEELRQESLEEECDE